MIMIMLGTYTLSFDELGTQKTQGVPTLGPKVSQRRDWMDATQTHTTRMAIVHVNVRKLTERDPRSL